MTRRIAALASIGSLLLLSFLARSAVADDARQPPPAKRDRVAVLIAADGETSLSDNLTEVAISTLAGERQWDFLGIEELRPTLSLLEPIRSDGLASCLERAPCRREVVLSTGATRAILGRVHAHEGGFAIELVLSDAARTGSERALERSAAPALKSLISAVQAAVRDLVLMPETESERETNAATGRASQPAPAPPAELKPTLVPVSPPRQPTIFPSHPLFPASAPPGLPPQVARRQSPLPGYLSYGAATVSVLSLSAAAITGSIAAGSPSGNTRAEVEADLHRREDYHTAAIGFLVSGAVFATVSIVALALRH